MPAVTRVKRRSRYVALWAATLLLVAFAGTVSTAAGEGSARILVDRENGPKGTYLLVRITVPSDSKVAVSSLGSPTRLVIDFLGTRIRRNESLRVPANKVISTVRLGAHPEKLRVVLDLTTSTVPEYTWSSSPRSAVVKILETRASSEAAVAVPPAVETNQPNDGGVPEETPEPIRPTATVAARPTARATVSPRATASPRPTSPPRLTATALPTKTPFPTVAPTDVPVRVEPTVEPPQVAPTVGVVPPTPQAELTASQVGGVDVRSVPGPAGAFLLEGFRFDYLIPNRVPVLKAILSNKRAKAELSKIDPKTYRVVVPNCTLSGPNVSLPQFPPADFIGFTMVSAQQFANKVEITINVDPGVLLGIFVRDNQIWVKRM